MVSERFNEPTEPFVFERLREDTIEQYEKTLVPSNELFVFLTQQNLEAMYESVPDGHQPTTDEKESILVAVHWIGVFMTSCYYP